MINALKLDAATIPGERAGTADVAALVAELASARSAIEQTFLGMGAHLSSSVKLLREVSAAHERMPAELTSPDFEAAAQHLHAIREGVIEFARTNAGENGHIGQLEAMARHVAPSIADLRNAVRGIGLISTNARIVAAGLSGEEGDFAAFTNDMVALGAEVRKVFSEFDTSYERFVHSLAAAGTANAVFAARHGDTMQHVSHHIEGHIAAVEQHRARAAREAEGHRELTSRIMARISTAVGALQVGDIARQRLEHVEQALLATAGGHEPGSVTATRVFRLQELQLAGALHEFEEQTAGYRDSIHRLAQDASGVLDSNSEHAQDILKEGSIALAAMIADLEKIDALLGDLEKMRDHLMRVGNDVAASVEVMVRNLGAVRHIEQQIRLLSINTSIQCRRLGDEGRALRVIAEELRSLAAETLRSAAAVMSGLGEADSLAQALTEAQASGSTGGVSGAGDRANTASRLIRDVVGRLESHVQAIARTGPACIRLLRDAASTASDTEQFGSTWSQVREKIADLAADVRTSEDDKLDLQFVAGLRAAYTMESERRLHDSLFDRADENLLPEAQDGSEGGLSDES